MSSRRRRSRKTNKWHKKWQNQRKGKEKLKIKLSRKQPPPLPSQCKLSPLDRHYHVSSLNHPVSKSSTNFVHNLSPFGNELIKHKSKEE
jgi:hypothetical protein